MMGIEIYGEKTEDRLGEEQPVNLILDYLGFKDGTPSREARKVIFYLNFDRNRSRTFFSEEELEMLVDKGSKTIKSFVKEDILVPSQKDGRQGYELRRERLETITEEALRETGIV